MAIGERIHFFRLMRGMTQKYLGQMIGFPEKSADVRLAQYETGSRSPKADTTAQLAEILNVSPMALSVPDIDSYDGLMHTLFALEDLYGLHIDEIDDVLCLRLDKSKGNTYVHMFDLLHSWNVQRQMLAAGEITKEQYDEWRYHYPEMDTTRLRAKVIPEGLSEMLSQTTQDDN